MTKLYSNFRNQIKTILFVFFLLFTLFFFSTTIANAQAFRTTWVTNDGRIEISTIYRTETYNYDITWINLSQAGVGNGSVTGRTGSYTINGLQNGSTYEIAITGKFPAISIVYPEDSKIRTIEEWGNIEWKIMAFAFRNCRKLTYNATDVPDLSRVTNTSNMFNGASAFNGNIGSWNTENITDMSAMFANTSSFNQDIGNWNTGNVTNMSSMFSGASAFNGNIGNWNTGNVTNMSSMFQGAFSFNRNIGNWNTENVTNMHSMFSNASSFNQDIANWSTERVTNMSEMFQGAFSFNGNIGNWNTESVTNMFRMFEGATSFNQPIGNWNISKVTNMNGMLDRSGINILNYDSTLIGWAAQNVQPSVSLGSVGLAYCNGATARNILTSASNNWNITGDSTGGSAVNNSTLPQNQYGLCPNTQTTLEMTGNGTVSWYDSPISTTPIHIGTNFTTPVLTTDSTYFYAQDSVVGCGISNRLEVLVTILSIDNITLPQNQYDVCPNSPTILKANGVGTLYWYKDITANPIAQGTTYTLPLLTSDTTYLYVKDSVMGCGSSDFKKIMITSLSGRASIQQGDLLETCATNFVLSAKPVYEATYTWFKENVQVGTGRTLETTFEARYKVRVSKNGCFDDSDFTTTRFVAASTPKIEQGDSVSFCGNGILNAQDIIENVVYEWIFNGNTIGSGTSISVSKSGIYTLKASQLLCESRATIAVMITPNVTLSANKMAICMNEKVVLSVTTGTGFTYKWFKNNVVISNSSASFSTSEIGKYKVEVTNQDGCKVTTSEIEISRLEVTQVTLKINKESGKDKTIDVTSQTTIDSVNWFKDGVLIPAFANQKLITPTQTGKYKAIVTYSTGCKSETEEKVFTFNPTTGIEEESAKIFTIYPNPSNGSFKVEFATLTNQKTKLTLVDGLGRIIHSQEIAMNQKTTSISRPKISAGVYVVQIISEGKVYTKQLVIQ